MVHLRANVLSLAQEMLPQVLTSRELEVVTAMASPEASVTEVGG
jgi:hypothetical protein